MILNKICPSYTIELVWQTHFEFTQAYREFSDRFYKKFLRLYKDLSADNPKNRKKYAFTKAEYERLFNYPPDPVIWEDEEDRFNEKYTKRVYVNIRRFWLTQSFKLINSNFLMIPKNFKTGLEWDKPSKIQLLTNRQARVVNMNKGKLFKWRRFYPNSQELYVQSNLSSADEQSIWDSSFDTFTPKTVSVDYFKNGGLVYLKDPFNLEWITSNNLGWIIVTGFYNSIKNCNDIVGINLDDIADACKTANMNP